ncbi:hypothetical protein [Paraeggerthella hongkongensis]|uniref:Uncharacterized protein n=1 Tax=Paraeggerthella hongkongensis TaxID=230658 RepID=A0A3N0BKS2_9ACTN|nr:hypothetical protein [Paraeggerthella hongkongensis]RNL48460.1 hypothetical protein DMP08_02315 [Paraeggerthella hongkongensis]
MKVERKKVTFASLLATTALVFGLASCAPQNVSEGEGSAKKSNDTTVAGEYVPYDPAVEAEHTSGKAIEGSEEEELQQERIAGGAVGGVVSQNLEPLEGIVDGPAGEYAPVYGIDGEPPAIGHGDNGSDCLSCHSGESSKAKQPLSHESANLSNEECTSCHKAR